MVPNELPSDHVNTVRPRDRDRIWIRDRNRQQQTPLSTIQEIAQTPRQPPTGAAAQWPPGPCQRAHAPERDGPNLGMDVGQGFG
ncbi:hypothetical protein VTI28DRAFT_5907 [Corynascus sepedonium]